ncbi:MAG: hypothetical protein DYH08_18775 [Actinobacteria bacterium ATB1]|nr:hypothetical protein [Actinobacteria bacterium ATB1]
MSAGTWRSRREQISIRPPLAAALAGRNDLAATEPVPDLLVAGAIPDVEELLSKMLPRPIDSNGTQAKDAMQQLSTVPCAVT